VTVTDPLGRITATLAARQVVADLSARQGPLMFVQSGGCCGGTAPMCFPQGEFITGPSDLLLGEIGGCPFYIDARLYQAWGEPQLILDVEPGFAEGFSLPAGEGAHFVVRGQSVPGTRPSCQLHPSGG
jgi:uncharacterized protein (DUF779 family)